jgi:hypothetical protein
MRTIITTALLAASLSLVAPVSPDFDPRPLENVGAISTARIPLALVGGVSIGRCWSHESQEHADEARTFHQQTGVCVCSNTSCKAVGWIGEPRRPGGGKGAECRLCGNQRVRRIYDSPKISIHHCFQCKTTRISEK